MCKLLFIFLLGHDIDFGHMEAVNLLSSNRYTEKQIVSGAGGWVCMVSKGGSPSSSDAVEEALFSGEGLLISCSFLYNFYLLRRSCGFQWELYMPSFHVTGPMRSASGTGRASSSPQHLASTLHESVYQCPLYNFVSEMGPNSHGFGPKAAGGGPRTAPRSPYLH